MKALGGAAAFSFVWATRGSASEKSSITLLRATDARLDTAGHPGHARAHISVSATSRAWKEALAAAVGRHESARGNGAIELGIRFGVSPQRNWAMLWKPAIDALGGIVGDGDRPRHPRDDRISLLVLGATSDLNSAGVVELDVWWAGRQKRVSAMGGAKWLPGSSPCVRSAVRQRLNELLLGLLRGVRIRSCPVS